MNPDPETRCGACQHPRRLHAVTETTARRVGCIAVRRNHPTSVGCACSRLQSLDPFDAPPTAKEQAAQA